MSDEHFLSRWSRRKREAHGRPRERAGAATTTPAESGSIAIPDAVEPEISADELARLPRIEDLTAESDLRQFLRKGVPLALRNAALRRVWTLDPKIRDHVGDALDYAYDWNVAGGVPGAGALADNEVNDLLQRVLGGGGEDPSETQPQPRASSGPDRIPETVANRASPHGAGPAEAGAAVPETAAGAARVRRRQGGALPS